MLSKSKFPSAKISRLLSRVSGWPYSLFDDGTSHFAAHWPIPDDWAAADFDDRDWPNAVTYTNDFVGVENKPAYTNFTDLFDNPSADAKFIWSSSLVHDNLVLLRTTIER